MPFPATCLSDSCCGALWHESKQGGDVAIKIITTKNVMAHSSFKKMTLPCLRLHPFFNFISEATIDRGFLLQLLDLALIFSLKRKG